MEESLGLGKGTLKDQIMIETQKKIDSVELKLQGVNAVIAQESKTRQDHFV